MGYECDFGSKSRSDIVCLEGNGYRPSHKGDGYRVGGSMYTLNTTEVHCVCYAIGSYGSNAWKSPNPHSGVYETQIVKTLDSTNCGYPACQQGGIAIVEVHHSGSEQK